METNIKTILLAVQQRLAERVPELAYIDKNWGQLDYEAPPVKWPCALLDKIHSALQRFTDGTFGPMFRTQIKKIAAVRAGECYKVLYQTAYTLPGMQEGQSAKLPPSSIRLEMK